MDEGVNKSQAVYSRVQGHKMHRQPIQETDEQTKKTIDRSITPKVQVIKITQAIYPV